ncbi:MAG: hypothetical protein LUF29_03345 [Oscillospiraceae bacterium]|nr:hypothetical protein [Oscillospiraceae bacterium]
MKTYEEHEMKVVSFATTEVFNDVVTSEIVTPVIPITGSKGEYSDS